MTTPEFQAVRTNTILYCEGFEAVLAFYRDVLKLDVVTEKDWFVEFRLTGDAFLSVVDAARATVPPGKGRGVTLSWQVKDVRDARRLLEDQGVEPTPVAWKWGAWVILFRDPEGNRIELWS